MLATPTCSAIDAMALKQKFHALVDDLISDGHAPPKGQAKAALPAHSAAGAAAAAGGGGASAGHGKTPGEAQASLAKIKIKKKAKAEGNNTSDSAPALHDAGGGGGGGPSLLLPAAGTSLTGQQPMDVDRPAPPPSSSAPPPMPTAASLDPASLAALQQLMASGVLDVGLQQAQAVADDSISPGGAASGPSTTSTSAAAAAAAGEEKKPPATRKEQRQLARELKAEKKAGVGGGAPQQQQLQMGGRPSQSPAPATQQLAYATSTTPAMMSAAAAAAFSPAPAAAAAPPPPPAAAKPKFPSLLAAFILRFPGEGRREVKLRNERGVKAHVLSGVGEGEVGLFVEVRGLEKGKGRGREDDDDDGVGAMQVDEDDGDVSAVDGVGTTATTPADDGLVNGGGADGGGHQQALPPAPGPPKRLFTIGVTSNSLPVESSPPSLLRRLPNNTNPAHQPGLADEPFVPDPPVTFHLSLASSGPVGRAGPVVGSGAWIVEVAVSWRDVDELTGAVVEQGGETYELFLRR